MKAAFGTSSNRSYRNTGADALPFPVLVLDRQTTVLDLNPSAELMFDCGIKTAVGCTLRHWLIDTCDLFAFFTTATTGSISGFSSRTGQDLVLEFIQGRQMTVSARMAPLEGGDAFILALFPSVTGDPMPGQTKTGDTPPLATLVGMLAHEIKNPLSGIKGAAQLLELSATGADRELAGMIACEVDRLTGLIDEMEVFGDSRTLKKQCVNIHSILNHCRHVAENGFATGIVFSHAFDPSLPDIRADPDLLKQVFLNIIKNAAEALNGSPDDPDHPDARAAGKDLNRKIRISTSFHSGLKLIEQHSGKSRATPFLVAAVEDNGPGVAAEIKPGLFEPSVSGKRGGKGLGLALAAKIVTGHGGWIDFSGGYKRTRFSVYLPLNPQTG